MAEPQGPRRDGPAHAGPLPFEEVAERAARLGITAERVLDEYARIAFATLRDIAEWGPGENGLQVKKSEELSEAQVAAIAEIVASAKDGTIYRIKMHDKKPVLDAIARYLGLLPALKPTLNESEPAGDNGGDPREVLARRVARIAAAAGVDLGNRGGG